MRIMREPLLCLTVLFCCFLFCSPAEAQIKRFDMGLAPVHPDYDPIYSGSVWAQGASPSDGWYSPGPGDTLFDLNWLVMPPFMTHHFQDDQGVLDNSVLVDSVILPQVGTPTNLLLKFRVNVNSNRKYRCVVYLGCVGTDADPTPLGYLGIKANGDTVIDGSSGDAIIARTMFGKGKDNMVDLDDCLGGYARCSFMCNPQGDPGSKFIEIEFTCTQANPLGISVQAVEIWPHQSPPFYFDHTAKLLKSTPGHLLPQHQAAAIGAFRNAFNSHNMDSQEIYDTYINGQITTPYLKAYANLWTVGWLDGNCYEDPVEGWKYQGDWNKDMLEEAIDILEAMPVSSLSNEVLVDAYHFRLAVNHMTTRGYSKEVVTRYNLDNNLGLENTVTNANMAAAEMLFKQIRGDMFEDSDSPYITTSPLFPRARFLRARTLYTFSTKLPPSDPMSPGLNVTDVWQGMIKEFEDYVNETDMSLGVFGRSMDLSIFYAIATTVYQPINNIIKYWKGEIPAGVDTGTPNNMTLTWWHRAGHIDVPDDPDAPDWANWTHKFLKPFKEGVRWWIDNRLKYGNFGTYGLYELGGGAGDDEEGAMLFYGLERAVYETYCTTGSKLQTMMNTYLFNCPNIDQNQCYFNNSEPGYAGDVEHAAEFTTNPLMCLVPTDQIPGNYAEYIDFIITLTQNAFFEPGQDDHWTIQTGTNPLERQFRSYFFDADDVIEVWNPWINDHMEYYDIPLNMRALQPTILFLNREKNGTTYIADYDEARDLIVELAMAWREHSLTEEYGPGSLDKKPVGIPPAAVWIDNGQAYFGWNPSWDLTPPDLTDGPDWWSTRKGYCSYFKNGEGYGAGVAYTYALLYAAYRHAETNNYQFLEPILESMKLVYKHFRDPKVDPDVDSEIWAAIGMRSTIVNAYFNARAAIINEINLNNLDPAPYTVANLDQMLESFGAAYPAYYMTKDKDAKLFNTDPAVIGVPFASRWLKYYWPLATSAVVNTDRIYLLARLCYTFANSMLTGDGVITWVNNDNDPVEGPRPLDLSILVKDYAPDGLTALIYNFEDSDRLASFRIWGVLKEGQNYDIELYNDIGGDEIPDTLLGSWNFTYNKPGDGLEITIESKSDAGNCQQILIISEP